MRRAWSITWRQISVCVYGERVLLTNVCAPWCLRWQFKLGRSRVWRALVCQSTFSLVFLKARRVKKDLLFSINIGKIGSFAAQFESVALQLRCIPWDFIDIDNCKWGEAQCVNQIGYAYVPVCFSVSWFNVSQSMQWKQQGLEYLFFTDLFVCLIEID